MKYVRHGSKIVLRIDKDEELIASITQVANTESVKLAVISGTGAVSTATIGTFLQDSKEDRTCELCGSMERVNLSETISQITGEAIYPTRR